MQRVHFCPAISDLPAAVSGLGWAASEKRTHGSHDEREPGKTCFGHFGPLSCPALHRLGAISRSLLSGRSPPKLQQLEPASDSSTRRFCARPCAVSFEATGFESPNPCAETRSGFTPSETTYSITFSARFCDRISFDVMPCRCSAGPIGALSV